MCNASLAEGCLPVSQRHAIVTPHLKKAGADQTDVKNYRPIFNLTFMSKIVEKLLCRQLLYILNFMDLYLVYSPHTVEDSPAQGHFGYSYGSRPRACDSTGAA